MALSKNYTGPTMSRMMAPLLGPPQTGVPAMFRATQLPIWFQPLRRLTMTGRMMEFPLAQPDYEIPPPPLGKFIFSTFPAAYKARTTTTPRAYPRLGQIWPDPMSGLALWRDARVFPIEGQFWP